MNERFVLDGEKVRVWLRMEHRKRSFLVEKLGISGSLVGDMLTGYVPQEETVKRLAVLMGIEVADLLIPKGATDEAS